MCDSWFNSCVHSFFSTDTRLLISAEARRPFSEAFSIWNLRKLCLQRLLSSKAPVDNERRAGRRQLKANWRAKGPLNHEHRELVVVDVAAGIRAKTLLVAWRVSSLL